LAVHEYAVVEATLEHAQRMAPNLRAADIEEVWASAQLEADQALYRGVSCSSHAWTGLVDGEPVCIFGVVPVSFMSGIGVPWMLGTDLVEEHATAFLRRNRRYVKQMTQAYNHLVNYVDDRNVKAIAWLEWLGFTMSEPQQFGALGLPFRRFEMRTEHV
jgi:hypothetical protein